MLYPYILPLSSITLPYNLKLGEVLINKKTGKPDFLYIKDNTDYSFYHTILDQKNLKKVHVSWCKTLEDMDAKRRFTRYHRTARTDGLFLIALHEREQSHRLAICGNCVKGAHINITQFGSIENFDFEKFSKEFSTNYKKKTTKDEWSKVGYANDHNKVKGNLIKKRGNRCEQCLSVSSPIEMHHIDGVKNNNVENNLRLLCRSCHAKQLNHQHMRVR